MPWLVVLSVSLAHVLFSHTLCDSVPAPDGQKHRNYSHRILPTCSLKICVAVFTDCLKPTNMYTTVYM